MDKNLILSMKTHQLVEKERHRELESHNKVCKKVLTKQLVYIHYCKTYKIVVRLAMPDPLTQY